METESVFNHFHNNDEKKTRLDSRLEQYSIW